MMNKQIPIIELCNVNFSYTPEVKILKDVNFEIFENEYVCIIGHNGSGKSTISKVLSGLLKPQIGCVKLFGKEIDYTNVRELHSSIGVVFQNPDNQFVGLTVEDDIAFGLENRKFPSELMSNVIKTSAKSLGIDHLLEKNSTDLSGGQKQKVAIAGILAINPKIIIFDESTSMLDPSSKNEIKQLMLDLKNEIKKTVISITHDMEEVINADKVIFLDKGKISFIGKPKDLFLKNDNLINLHLDYPFILKLSYQLKKDGLNIVP
ncbi:MAG: energy-coupling factor transporter ATPase, partial [Ureaplasma sp.]|nr:energy-coupling factor transporter ATPase [Ureaplasma sp.]